MVSVLKQSAKYTFFASLLVSQVIQAAPGMSEQMMQQLQAAQECMSKVDQSKLKELQTRGQKMEADLKALCAAGKRDEAMSTAMKYSKEVDSNPQLKQMQKCSKMMEDIMPESTIPSTSEGQEDEGGHVCDEM